MLSNENQNQIVLVEMTEAIFEKERKENQQVLRISVEVPPTKLTHVDLVSLSGSRFMIHTAANL